MSFPNVRIVNAAQLAPVAAGQAGLRAYIDPETRALRAPTPEELAQERHDAQANGLLARTMMQEASIHVPIFATATGAIGAMLDESHMLFSVVRIRENGQREEFCVAGPEAAGKLLDTTLPPLTVVQRKGDRDER